MTGQRTPAEQDVKRIVDFLTAAGHRFNNDAAISMERSRVERLKAVIGELLETV